MEQINNSVLDGSNIEASKRLNELIKEIEQKERLNPKFCVTAKEHIQIKDQISMMRPSEPRRSYLHIIIKEFCCQAAKCYSGILSP